MEKQLKIDDLKEHLKTVEKERNEHEGKVISFANVH